VIPRPLFVVAAAVAVACGASTSTEERPPGRFVPEPTETDTPATVAVPQNPVDRGIRRDLNGLIAADPDLRSREISFIVSHGDVSVTGTVRTEDERRKFNDLAMNIEGVKSVANNLRIAE
jgi:osmotically-inducible protein OsmY